MDLENLKRQAREAAKSNFLWELGMRLEQPRQAFRLSNALMGISNADEKNIRAVAKLRIENPNALFEIRPNTAYGGEKTMVETAYGLEHFKKISAQKDWALWEKIAVDLGVTVGFPKAGKEEIILIRKSGFDECPTDFRIVRNIPTAFPDVIAIWPSNAFDAQGAQYKSQIAPAFFNNLYEVDQRRSTYARSNHWRMAVISVKDKKYLALGKKLARAYERETARRRKPAKAVVLKNY